MFLTQAMSCWYFTSIPYAIVTIPLVSQHLILSECKTIESPFMIILLAVNIRIIMVLFITLSQDTLILTLDFVDGETATQNHEVIL